MVNYKCLLNRAIFLIVLLFMQPVVLYAEAVPVKNTSETKLIPPILIILPIALFGVWRVTHRSGVKNKDIRRAMPGDSIIANANWVINRSGIIDAPIDAVWPWIEQLGRNRAGWYAPNWMENMFGRHALRTIDTAYQHVKDGDILDDWGPGYQRVLMIDSPNMLLVDGVKKVKIKTSGKDTLANMDVTILTVLEKVDSIHTKLIFRLRGRVSILYYIPARALGGLFDYTTFQIMASGLNERVKEDRKKKKGQINAIQPEDK